jgi:hypothetical protein
MNPNGLKGVVRTGRIGLEKYAAMLASVYSKPLTHREINDQVVHRQEQAVREAMWRMVNLGIAHVPSYAKSDRGAQQLPIARFRFGPGQSVPYPIAKSRRKPGVALKPRPELIQFAAIIRCFLEGSTVNEAAEATGSHKQSIKRVITVLRAAKVLRIVDWPKSDSGIGQPAKLYVFGTAPDVPRPPRMSQAERDRRRSDRLRALRATKAVVDAITRSGAMAQRMGIKPYHMLGKSVEPA